MLNNKGFSLIESLVAVTLLMIMISTLIPITNLLIYEREVLHQKRLFGNELHAELQPYLWDDQASIPTEYSKEVNETKLIFTFSAENKLLKGCVEWKNVKNKTDQICLYGYSAK
ncbi:type II secretion system protein [Virgibacillus litoralis]|uniref:Type II secretory pathway pseudopilin PulG n=1 Tax=Virgibacillus litoralis TaxID=578221 RepID=A0ABS4HIY2_9BACI|nr:type II secretion system protein [Virgibacillus litoralis]MBP1950357.1 type II secretory pathway pseudopilin PulG [Virgibacillus litoralis]